MTDGSITIRDVTDGDLAAWADLYRGYRDFYRLAPDEDVIRRVWAWLLDEQVDVRGLVAERDDRIVGLAHYRHFHRPSSGTIGLYLDDLFTDPAARRTGAGHALLAAVGSRAAVEGCSVVRWITARDNGTARRLYDEVAEATPWITYDLSPTA